MTQYRCKTCDIIQDFQPILRGNLVPCTTPNCIGQISHRNRYTDPNPYAHVSFATAKVSKSSTGLSLPGRSASAPPPPNLTSWPRPNMPNGLVYCQTLNDPNWNGATDTDILLAYNLLDMNTQGIQGLVIDFPNANRDTEVRKHFDACTGAMMTPKTSTATTEATGEIAAAMWVLSQNAYNGFKMVWGFNVHSGAGIDQIWYKNDPNHPVYLVVEAKGPGASLSQNIFQPTGYGQMEEDWVVDRLEHMKTNHNALYNQIIGHLGLTIAVKHAHYNKGSKSYFHASQIANNRKGKMSGVTIEAKWLPSGMLSHKVASHHTYAFS